MAVKGLRKPDTIKPGGERVKETRHDKAWR